MSETKPSRAKEDGDHRLGRSLVSNLFDARRTRSFRGFTAASRAHSALAPKEPLHKTNSAAAGSSGCGDSADKTPTSDGAHAHHGFLDKPRGLLKTMSVRVKRSGSRKAKEEPPAPRARTPPPCLKFSIQRP